MVQQHTTRTRNYDILLIETLFILSPCSYPPAGVLLSAGQTDTPLIIPKDSLLPSGCQRKTSTSPSKFEKEQQNLASL